MIAGTFRSPFIAYGEGVSQKLGEYCTSLGKNALIVTDAVLEKAGILNGLKESLSAAKLEFNIFDQVTTEPVVKYAEEGLRIQGESMRSADFGGRGKLYRYRERNFHPGDQSGKTSRF